MTTGLKGKTYIANKLAELSTEEKNTNKINITAELATSCDKPPCEETQLNAKIADDYVPRIVFSEKEKPSPPKEEFISGSITISFYREYSTRTLSELIFSNKEDLNNEMIKSIKTLWDTEMLEAAQHWGGEDYIEISFELLLDEDGNSSVTFKDAISGISCYGEDDEYDIEFAMKMEAKLLLILKEFIMLTNAIIKQYADETLKCIDKYVQYRQVTKEE